MRRYSLDLGQVQTPRRWRDVQRWVHYVADYPDRHHGSVVALTERAIRYHRDEVLAAGWRTLATLGHDTKTAVPPVPLPDQPGVRFLPTVGELVEEGERVSNCLASYAGRAVKGNCYLYHVEHNGEQASVEVDWRGNVVQASGPHNRQNGAAGWGRGVLAEWGRRFGLANPKSVLYTP